MLHCVLNPKHAVLGRSVANADRAGKIHQRSADIIIDAVVHVQPLQGCAGLPIVDEGAPEQSLRDQCRIRVRQHNAGVVSADFKRQPLEAAGGAHYDFLTGRRNGEVEETGLGAGVLNDPVMGIVWLAGRMATYGQRIEAGQVILAGSFIRPIECPPGADIHADYGPTGQVSCRFE